MELVRDVMKNAPDRIAEANRPCKKIPKIENEMLKMMKTQYLLAWEMTLYEAQAQLVIQE